MCKRQNDSCAEFFLWAYAEDGWASNFIGCFSQKTYASAASKLSLRKIIPFSQSVIYHECQFRHREL